MERGGGRRGEGGRGVSRPMEREFNARRDARPYTYVEIAQATLGPPRRLHVIFPVLFPSGFPSSERCKHDGRRVERGVEKGPAGDTINLPPACPFLARISSLLPSPRPSIPLLSSLLRLSIPLPPLPSFHRPLSISLLSYHNVPCPVLCQHLGACPNHPSLPTSLPSLARSLGHVRAPLLFSCRLAQPANGSHGGQSL